VAGRYQIRGRASFLREGFEERIDSTEVAVDENLVHAAFGSDGVDAGVVGAAQRDDAFGGVEQFRASGLSVADSTLHSGHLQVTAHDALRDRGVQYALEQLACSRGSFGCWWGVGAGCCRHSVTLFALVTVR